MTETPALVLAGHPLLEFQPAVDLATGRLLGFEALMRWAHPTRGHISPGILVPWAEANGDIIPLNAWVLAEACRQAQAWPSGIQLAVNCSIVQLRQGEASLAVAKALQGSGLNPDRLTIEITEHTIADERAAADLRALSTMGVHLAVDDVGTMWSSLNSLRRFAIETVKIDAAFIANLEADEGMNRAIVDAIVHVGHSLAMSAVAEGVETEAQVAILREFGTDVAQGFFFARPMPSHDALVLANTEPRPVYPLTATGAPAGTEERAHTARSGATHGLVLLTTGAPEAEDPAHDPGPAAGPAPHDPALGTPAAPDDPAPGTPAGPAPHDPAHAPAAEATADPVAEATADPVAEATADPAAGPAAGPSPHDPAPAPGPSRQHPAAATGSVVPHGREPGGARVLADTAHVRGSQRPRFDQPGPEPGVRLPADVEDWIDPDVGSPTEGSATA